MKRMPVESSSIASFGYDPETRVLEITFQNGRTYRYFDVPSIEYEGFSAASSKRRYFVARLSGRFRYEQV